MNIFEEALIFHAKNKGKLATKSKAEVKNFHDLSLVYTPGVAEPCREIHRDEKNVYKYTMKANTVAVITNGTAVLGLGDIGTKASIPVMEGKSILFKKFAGIDSFPICIDSKDPQEIVDIVTKISAVFGAINLEDIKAPECFQIEEELKKRLDIPVFHDDQHGTAIVVVSGIMNALKVVNKVKEEVKILIIGTGSAGIAVAKMLLLVGFKNIVLYDKKGAVCQDSAWLNFEQKKMSLVTNAKQEKGSLEEIIEGKDIVIGVSGPNVISKKMVSSMNKDAIVFALANPVPEIMPEEAKAAGAKVVATGRSDFPNQINNVLVFPGVFKGALKANATQINDEMKRAAVNALTNIIDDKDINFENIIPTIFNEQVVKDISEAVFQAAIRTNVFRKI